MARDEKTAANEAKAKPKAVIALAAVTAALAIGVAVMLLLPEPAASDDAPAVTPGSSAVYEDLTISGLERTAIRLEPEEGSPFSVRINSETGGAELVADNAVFGAYPDGLDAVVAAATSLLRLQRVTEEADDAQLALFGLDKPVFRWELSYADGTSQRFELGSELPTGEGSYVRLSGSRSVYILRQVQSENIRRTLEELYDISFLPIPPSTQDEQTWMLINYVRLDMHDGEVIEVRKRQEEDYLDAPLGTSSFRLTEPFEADCNDYMIQTIFMEAITRIQPGSVVAVHPSDLSAYGLDRPVELTVTLPLADEGSYERKLLIGNVDDTLTGRYVMIEGHDAVLLDTGGRYEFLDVDPYQLRQRLIWLHMINTVSSVEFYLDGINRVLEMKHGDDMLEGTLDGDPLSETNTRRLYTSALNVLASGSTDAAIPDVPAAYSITMRLLNGSSETVEMFPIGDSRFLIVYEGVSTGSYITRQVLFQNLLSRFDTLDAGGELSR